MTNKVVLAAVFGANVVVAHFTFTDVPSQIACDIEARGLGEKNCLSQPLLEDQPFEEWWMHGQRECQYKATTPFELPARGTTSMVMSSSIRNVPMPIGTGSKFAPEDPDYVMTPEEWGYGPTSNGNRLLNNHNIHAYGRNDTSGCALAIAYKSEALDVKPEDFVVFTVVHDCPKRQRETIEIPDLPACPDGKCICAWFWIPKNSGTKNFYMTPFECKVTGAKANASPVDVKHAIPPRRCVDPTNCNFGPRQPLYWLGAGKEINMPESLHQSPHYSIKYGFREGAQHDIFESTNPRRLGISNGRDGFPSERKCGGKQSRLTNTTISNIELTSPNCRCTAKWNSTSSKLIVRDDGIRIYNVKFNNSFGPEVIRSDPKYKASDYYFPTSENPFRIDINNGCYLSLTDNNGMVVWESEFNSNKRKAYIVDTFTGFDADPNEWDTASPTGTPTAIPSTNPTAAPTGTPTADNKKKKKKKKKFRR